MLCPFSQIGVLKTNLRGDLPRVLVVVLDVRGLVPEASVVGLSGGQRGAQEQ